MNDHGFPTDRTGSTSLSWRQGMNKGDLSRFVEEPVPWPFLDRTVEKLRRDNHDQSAKEPEARLDEGRAEGLAGRRGSII
ncbi:MAG: ribbon-helix-helix domain-containing protein [Burkholderiaceae bacterium]